MARRMTDLGAVARPYARAIFDLAAAGGKLEEWSQALSAAASVVENGDAERILSSPSLTDEQRAGLVGSIAAALPEAGLLDSQEGRGLLRLLAENDRLQALPEISEQFEELKAEAENKLKVTLISAAAVEPEVADKVTRALEQRLGRKVELELEVDPSLLGGAVVRAEDMVIDGSVRTRLQRLAQSLAG